MQDITALIGKILYHRYYNSEKFELLMITDIQKLNEIDSRLVVVGIDSKRLPYGTSGYIYIHNGEIDNILKSKTLRGDYYKITN